MTFGTPRFGRISDTNLEQTRTIVNLPAAMRNHASQWSPRINQEFAPHWMQQASKMLFEAADRISELELRLSHTNAGNGDKQ